MQESGLQIGGSAFGRQHRSAGDGIAVAAITGTSSDELKFIEAEARHGTKSIGFIPRAGLERAADLGRVVVVRNNGDLVGFAVFGGSGTTLRVFQVWVREDARLLEHGRKLLDELDRAASRRAFMRIRLWCLAHLPAVVFWRALGFREYDRRVRSKDDRRTQVGFEVPTAFAWRSLLPEAGGPQA